MDLYYDDEQAAHDPREPHRFNGELRPPAENADRSERILHALRHAGFPSPIAPSPIGAEVLQLVHTDRYLTFLRSAHARWREAVGGPEEGEAAPYIRPLPGATFPEPTSVLAQLGRFSFDVDPILAGTWAAATASAASAVAAARAAADGERGAYALCRPPGHHAAPEAFGGYCYLNNAAIAAAWLTQRGARVAILDVDAHHGNGTQAVFWERGDVLTISIHGDPLVHFPFFGGFADERGAGPGEGAHRNYPLPSGARWDLYSDALDDALRAIEGHGTDVLVVSLGVDADEDDGVLGLRGDDFARLGARLGRTGARVAFVQEGGYGADVLERDVPAVLLGFEDE